VLPQTVEAMVARHRTGMFDHTFKHVMDWGLGFIINSPVPDTGMPYGFGRHASPRTFGHGGAMSSGGLADPEHGLVAAYIFNGMAGEARHQQRVQALTAAIYEDVGLA
jgi:CubicO group peptidase (beta-lactamase class C family)